VLIGSVFRAVFSPVPLSLCRCRMLCDQMVTGLGSLPRTAKVHEWESVYAVLRAACYGEPVSIPNLEPAEDLLSRSHRVALRVLQVAELEPGPVNKFLLEDLIAPYDGWVIDLSRSIQNGSVVWGTRHAGEAYFPPALRLALAVQSLGSDGKEFPSMWALRWREVHEALRQGAIGQVMNGYHDHIEGTKREEVLHRAAQEADDLHLRYPRDARVLEARGHVLLLCGDLEAARETLVQCLQLPSFGGPTHSNARYNLACVYARIGEDALCREFLTAEIGNRPALRNTVGDDPDFASLKGRAWFQELLSNTSV
jgi:hypothetical protein